MSSDDIGDATRAVVDALRTLTRSVTQNLADVGQDVNSSVASQLRAASQELADASDKLSRTGAGKRRRRADDTRQSLVTSARRLFAERGYEAASLGDVAAAAGFTKGAVYANFESKQELLLAVAADQGAEDEAWFAERASVPAAEVLAEMQDVAEGEEGRLLVLELALYAARHPDLREEITQRLGPGLDAVARLVADARSGDGEHPTEQDADAAAAVVALRMYGQLAAGDNGGNASAVARRVVARLVGGTGRA